MHTIIYVFTVALSPMFPDSFMLGLEIRVKVSDYVNDRIQALRIQHPDQYQNIAVLRTNAMKYLPNFFQKGQVIMVWQCFFFLTLLDSLWKKSLACYWDCNVVNWLSHNQNQTNLIQLGNCSWQMDTSHIMKYLLL